MRVRRIDSLRNLAAPAFVAWQDRPLRFPALRGTLAHMRTFDPPIAASTTRIVRRSLSCIVSSLQRCSR
jgi:hypothetical protein